MLAYSNMLPLPAAWNGASSLRAAAISLNRSAFPLNPITSITHPSASLQCLAARPSYALSPVLPKRTAGARITVPLECASRVLCNCFTSDFRLKTGQSATYYVTVTNNSAPVGEWRFGSLTWIEKSGLYSVKSPIAVKAALFSAPAGDLLAAARAGSTSFDVGFGYTGSYALQPMVWYRRRSPRTTYFRIRIRTSIRAMLVTVQTCTSSPFPGAAFFRIAMPPEATEADADLDIFVYGPGGEYFESTAGGTNELIDIEFPSDGTWDVYVHGWSAPGGDSNYDLYTWAISATPGGNMTINRRQHRRHKVRSKPLI